MPCIQDKNVVHIEDLNINSLYDIPQNIAAGNQHKTLTFFGKQADSFCYPLFYIMKMTKKVSAESFFKLAVSGKLTANQIYFTSSHPFDLCKKKVSELENLPKIVESEAFVLENIDTKSAVFKFGFTELNFTVCLCEDINASGDKQSDYYLPQSFRFDCFIRY